MQSIAGQQLAYNLPGKLFLGGGGGGGQQDNGNIVYNGGNGGGIVLIKADKIDAQGTAIVANGDNVQGDIKDEGGSGGGAGGSVFLFCDNFNGNLSIFANGGDGNSNFNQLFPGNCHGPGAGGGGGVAGFSIGSLPPQVTFTAAGGKAGKVLNPASSCFNTTHGAADGQAGGTVFNLIPTIPAALSLQEDIVICPGTSLTLTAPTGFASYQWSTGSTTNTTTVTQPGKYLLTVTNSAGCAATDSVYVDNFPITSSNLGKDTSFCVGDSIVLDAGIGFQSYNWQDGSTDRYYKVTTPGKYFVRLMTAGGCMASDTITIGLYSKPSVSFGADKTLCAGETLLLDAGAGFQKYFWQDGSAAQQLMVKVAGNYTVKVTDNNGCIARDTIAIAYYPAKTIDLGADKELCSGETVLLNATAGFLSYLWKDGSVSQQLKVTQTGEYFVAGTYENNCVAKDTIQVNFHVNPVISLGADADICPDEALLLDPGPGFQSYLWQDGTVAQQYRVTAAGQYYVKVQDNIGCEARDTVHITVFPDCNLKTVYYVPNSFTPNRDGLNDVFKMVPYNFRSIDVFELALLGVV